MKTITYTKKILWFFPCKQTIEKPVIRRAQGVSRLRPEKGTSKLRANTWKCIGGGYTGYGITPWGAWNDWANWALI
jgi:hypothetical protein